MLGDALLYGFVYAVILLGRIKNIDLGGCYRYKVYSIISHFCNGTFDAKISILEWNGS